MLLQNWLNRKLDFKSPEVMTGVHLWLLLMKAHRAVYAKALASIEETELCFSDFAVLEILLHKGPMAVNAIGARIGLTSGSATTAIDRLEERGLVTRRSESEDRRSRMVHLTAAGRRLIERAFAKHAAEMEAASACLTPAERRDLGRLLKKFGTAQATSRASA